MKYRIRLIIGIFFYQQLKKYKINLTKLNVVNKLTSELSLIISQRRDEYYSQNCV